MQHRRKNFALEENSISSFYTLITYGTEPENYVNIDENVLTEARFQILNEIIEARVSVAWEVVVMKKMKVQETVWNCCS